MGSHLSQPPPEENTAVGAWYRSGSALKAVDELRSELNAVLLRELGALSKKIDDVRRSARRSDTDLRRHWDEDSNVRNLRVERDHAIKQLEEWRVERLFRKRKSIQWTMDFAKILVAAIAGAYLRSLFQS